MKINLTTSPRTFSVNEVAIKDHGKIALEPDEMISFVTASGREFDFTAKDWGFYATPSINGRLKKQGFKTALVENPQGRIYVMVVEQDKVELFEEYCRKEGQSVQKWLDEHPSEGVTG
jgi:hypothetical protein